MLRLKAESYMLLVGIAELACVGLMIFGRTRVSLLATWVLLLIMAGAVYTHVMVGDKINDMTPAFAAFVLVLTRLYTMGALNDVQIKVKV